MITKMILFNKIILKIDSYFNNIILLYYYKNNGYLC